MSNDRINFYYDAQRQGYDTTQWRTLSGVVTATGNGIRVNSAECIHYGDIYKGRLVMNLTIPVAPTAGHSRRFGFAQKALGAYVGFRINGTVFQAETIDGDGNTETETITWDSSWTNTTVRYEVIWNGFSATFKINGARYSFLNSSAVVKHAMSIYFLNSVSDSLEVSYVQAKDMQGYLFNGTTSASTFIIPSISVNDQLTVTDSITPLDFLTMTVNDQFTITELVTGAVSASNISVNDTSTITESVTPFIHFIANVNDVITLTESVTVNRDPSMSVNDQFTITESVTMLL